MLRFLLNFLLCAICTYLLCGCEQEDSSAPISRQNALNHVPHALSWPLSAPVTSFDPIRMTNIPEATVARQLYDTLVRLDPNLSLAPGIAQKWEIDPSGREYTFHLKPDLFFHDGSALTAIDVKRSLERLARAGEGSFLCKHLKMIDGYEPFLQGRTQEISGIRVIDKSQVHIRLIRPHAPFLPALSIYQAGIVSIPDNSLQVEGSHRLVGSGPFVLEAVDEQRIIMRPFSHFVDGMPRINELIFKIYPGADVKKAAEDFLAGELSAVPLAGPVEDIIRERADYKVIRRNMIGLSFYGFNTRKGSSIDVSVRRHITKSIDRQFITATIHKNKRALANTIIPIGLAGYRPELTLVIINNNLHPNPPKHIRMLSVTRNSAVEAEMAYLAGRLHALGAELQVEYILDWKQFYERLAAGSFDMFRLSWYPDTPDLDEMFFPLFHSQGEYNHFGYANPRIDELLEQARSLSNLEERITLYQQAEDILLEDLPAIPLSYEALDRAVKFNVFGLNWNSVGETYNSFASVWIE